VQHLAAGGGDALAHAVVDVDVGAAEAVDRLLGVTDHEEGPGRREAEMEMGRSPFSPPPTRKRGQSHFRDSPHFREQQEDLGLDGIGVLELVDEEPAVLLLQRLAHGAFRAGAAR